MSRNLTQIFPGGLVFCYNFSEMAMKLENCWMTLPGHKVGYCDVEIKTEAAQVRTIIGAR